MFEFNNYDIIQSICLSKTPDLVNTRALKKINKIILSSLIILFHQQLKFNGNKMLEI